METDGLSPRAPAHARRCRRRTCSLPFFPSELLKGALSAEPGWLFTLPRFQGDFHTCAYSSGFTQVAYFSKNVSACFISWSPRRAFDSFSQYCLRKLRICYTMNLRSVKRHKKVTVSQLKWVCFESVFLHLQIYCMLPASIYITYSNC